MLVDAHGRKMAARRIGEVYDWLERNKLHLHHWFFSTDLTHYKIGGRISASSRYGDPLNICPLMNMNDNGAHSEAKIMARKTSSGNRKKDGGPRRDKTDYSGKCLFQIPPVSRRKAVAELVEADVSALKRESPLKQHRHRHRIHRAGDRGAVFLGRPAES